MKSICFYMFVFCALATAFQAYAQRAPERVNGHEAAAGELIVKFRTTDPKSRSNVQTFVDADAPIRLLKAEEVYLLRSRSKSAQQAVSMMVGHSEVLYAEPNFIIRTNSIPNDVSFSNLWGMANISAPTAWDQTTGSKAVVAGVVDTGVDYTHPDLAGNIWTAPASFTVTVGGLTITCFAGSHGFNAIANTCDPMDNAQHGTHVSGTIGAVGNNVTGVSGVNWNTQIMGLKFMDATGSGYTSDAIKSIDFAIQAKSFFGASAQVRVLSASWGSTGFSQSLQDAISRAGTAEMLFVAAAGNSSANNDSTGSYPANYALPNVMSVAATDSNDLLAGFSNYGSRSVHLGAPGVSILSTVPGGGYAWMSGTSMATPHVSGAAALILSACSLTTAQLKATLLQNTDAVGSLAATTITGGRLNVAKAVTSCAVASTPATTGSSVFTAANITEPWRMDSPVTLGVKIRSDVPGQITGIRFWKSSASDNGTHIGLLYSNTGTVLAQATFAAETGSGWQSVKFSSPVAIAANTTYIAAYYSTSGWSADGSYFLGKGGDASPLHALQYGVDGGNGVYSYGSTPAFPLTSRGANYWTDVLFSASAPGSTPPPVTPPVTPPATGSSIFTTVNITESWHMDSPVTLGVKIRSDVAGQITGIRFWKGSASDNGTHTGLLYSNTGAVLAQATFTAETGSGWQSVSFLKPVAIAANTTYIAAYYSASGWSADGSYFQSKGADAAPLHALQNGVDGGNSVYSYGSTPVFPLTSRGANYWTDVIFSSSTPAPIPAAASSIFTTVNITEPWHMDSPVTLGVKIRSDVPGQITGVRFWKGSASDNGTHTGLLYSNTGALLAQATFTAETGSGWQSVTFSSPVTIAANTTYVAAYYSTSGWSADGSYFQSKGADAAPLHALQNGVDGGNSVYSYGSTPVFPLTSRGANYWTDVLFIAQ